MPRIALLAGATPLAVITALALLPRSALDALPDVCLFRRWLGIECWGCGMTRAVWYLLRGDWDSAVAYHPWAHTVLAAGCLISIVVLVAWLVASGRLPLSDVRRACLGLWLFLAVATLPATVGFAALGTAHLAPTLRYPHSRPCPLCGLTGAFTDAARGRLGAASAANSGSGVLYVCLVANQVAVLVWLGCFRKRHSRAARGGVACRC
jgi:hypothetical protein